MSSLETEVVFRTKILQKDAQGPTKVHFLHINMKVRKMVIMNDLKSSMLSYYVIYVKISEKSCSKQRMKL